MHNHIELYVSMFTFRAGRILSYVWLCSYSNLAAPFTAHKSMILLKRTGYIERSSG